MTDAQPVGKPYNNSCCAELQDKYEKALDYIRKCSEYGACPDCGGYPHRINCHHTATEIYKELSEDVTC